jgi:hypothetical protein
MDNAQDKNDNVPAILFSAIDCGCTILVGGWGNEEAVSRNRPFEG